MLSLFAMVLAFLSPFVDGAKKVPVIAEDGLAKGLARSTLQPEPWFLQRLKVCGIQLADGKSDMLMPLPVVDSGVLCTLSACASVQRSNCRSRGLVQQLPQCQRVPHTVALVAEQR